MIHLILRLIYAQPNIYNDLVLFNLIGPMTSAIAFKAPLVTDRVVAVTIGSGLADLAMYEAKRSKSGVLMWQGEKIK